ncbi:DUF3732 domain-containing protein [uncultured Alistipes sp.]|uniref:DUF3732 domain-containing protein n=1 Tax=uncultured Alistipes sp. TaxID=538949 RepID=UPI00272BE260|nr:DUF3732 domain-containing protein [uncultured Alistipes sp.]
MRAHIKYIGIVDQHDHPHAVEFFTGINIITGRSSTGKSALIEIFDYCFGASEYTVPEGVITEAASIYFVVFSIKNSFLVLGRKPNDKHGFIKEETILPQLEDLTLDYFESSYFLSIKDFNMELGRYFGIDITDTDEDLAQKAYRKNQAKKPRPSIRNFTPFMLQHQNLVANKHSLFYRFDENAKREQTIEQFKIFVGFVNQEFFTKSQELNALEQNLNRLKLKQSVYENDRNVKNKEIKNLLKEYIAITGIDLLSIDFDHLIQNPQKFIETIRNQDIDVDENSNEYISQLKNLEAEKNRTLGQIRTLTNKLREIEQSVAYAEKYKNAVGTIIEIKETQVHLSQCPFCSHNNETLIKEANQLEEAIHWLNTELDKTPYMLDSFETERKKVQTEIGQEKEVLWNINQKISAILKIANELQQNRSLAEQGLKIRLKIEAILETFISEYLNINGQIDEVSKKIQTIKNYIQDHYNLDEKLQKASLYINKQMNKLGANLDFEDSYKPINLHFDINSFELYHKKQDGAKVYLRSMGSGANWLYCHLSLFMGLNRFFCYLGDDCLIPPILFLDQPSQVYFPVSIKDDNEVFDAQALKEKEGIENSDMDDIKAVENFFNELVAFCDNTVYETKVYPQIIITDHADKLNLTNADFETLVHGRRWRSKNDGFIKKDM